MRVKVEDYESELEERNLRDQAKSSQSVNIKHY